MSDPHYETLIPPGGHWSFTVRRGLALRVTDVDGGGNCSLLFFNPTQLLERYNAPDTLKCQHTFRLTRGHCLYSDMGRIFCSIVEDSVGWHETVCGNSTRASVAARHGARSYQEALNERHQNGYDAFLTELAKYGLGRRDMASSLNLFSKVSTDDDGNLGYASEHSGAGDEVVLRFEMDTLVLLHACPHPLAPHGPYPAKPIRLRLEDAPPMTDDDVCLNACEENRRGYQNNALYHLGLPA